MSHVQQESIIRATRCWMLECEHFTGKLVSISDKNSTELGKEWKFTNMIL